MILLIMMMGFQFQMAFSQTASTEGVIQSEQKLKRKMSFSYWSMFSGPRFGGSLRDSVDANGQSVDTGSNFFQILFSNYEISSNQSAGLQLRTSTDAVSPELEVLNPRLFFHQKNVIDNSYFSLGLQPFIEIPTTRSARENTSRGTLLFAQNWNFKRLPKDWSVSITTMVNQNFFERTEGRRSTDLIALPSLGFQISQKLQWLSWGWFDAAIFHGGQDQKSGLGGWSDNYVRTGVNVSVTDFFQIYPCIQFFTDQLRANNTTLGLELSAQF